jgi:hypothetical protein
VTQPHEFQSKFCGRWSEKKYLRKQQFFIKKKNSKTMMLFGLAFVVEVVVEYNSFMHKIQPQKLIFLVFCGFFSGSHTQPQIQTHFHLKYKHTIFPTWPLSWLQGINIFFIYPKLYFSWPLIIFPFSCVFEFPSSSFFVKVQSSS